MIYNLYCVLDASFVIRVHAAWGNHITPLSGLVLMMSGRNPTARIPIFG